MNKKEISISSIEQLPALAKEILKMAGGRKVFVCEAPMGSGKTTLIKEICRQLGSHDNFSSPTFSIVNEYSIDSLPASADFSDAQTSPRKIYHIDLYRLKNTEEARSVGIEEYLYSGNYCFIEWPELIESILPENRVKILMKPDDYVRNVSIFIT